MYILFQYNMIFHRVCLYIIFHTISSSLYGHDDLVLVKTNIITKTFNKTKANIINHVCKYFLMHIV